jgi:hypothetical protein
MRLKNADLLADLQNQLSATEKVDTSEILAKLEQYNTELSANSKLYAEKELYENQLLLKHQLESEYKDLNHQHEEIEQQQNTLIEDLNIPYKLKVIEGVMNVQE